MTVLDQFLTSINTFLKTKDAQQLQAYLRVEPPLPQEFTQLSQELKASWQDTTKLEAHIERLVADAEDTKADEGGSWPGFIAFLNEYFGYWRTGNHDDLLATHQLLSNLVNSAIMALSHTTHGIIMLPATMQLCAALSKLAMTLDKRPDLTIKLKRVEDADQGERKTLVESTAELIQRALTMCLSERSTHKHGITPDGRPEGKKVGIYSFANLVLSLLFRCRKTRLANQIFSNISASSPPLGLYPASHRVTYLYYLGRYHFTTSHFYEAQQCLQSAYDQCHARCLGQRRSILIYLIPTNIILGRFPSEAFMSRPEAVDLMTKFIPVTNAIRKGNMIAFKQALGAEGGNQQWFFQHGILLPMLNRCEPLVWRSFIRRVFLLTYKPPTDPTSRAAPIVDLHYLLAAARFCQKKLEGWTVPVDTTTQLQSGRTHTNTLFMKTPDLVPPPEGRKRLGAHSGVIYGNRMPKMIDIEAVVASLVQQKLLHGFMSHSQKRFAIVGSKQNGGPLNAGFPRVWDVLHARIVAEGREQDPSGWVKKVKEKGSLGGVFNLTGIARAAGSN